jgi:hypothetical protein
VLPVPRRPIPHVPRESHERSSARKQESPFAIRGGSALLALSIALGLAACGAGTEATGSVASEPAAATPLVTPEPTSESTPEPAATPEPTAQPTRESSTYAVGDVITITQDGEPWADFTVLEVSEAAEFADPDGFYNDTPQTDGYIFLNARVRYEAIADGVDYNPFDFQVFVDGQAVDGFTFAINAPEPQLSSGTLPAGRSAEGWLLYEVPPDGEVLLSYAGNVFLDEAPIFEVVLRND